MQRTQQNYKLSATVVSRESRTAMTNANSNHSQQFLSTLDDPISARFLPYPETTIRKQETAGRMGLGENTRYNERESNV